MTYFLFFGGGRLGNTGPHTPILAPPSPYPPGQGLCGGWMGCPSPPTRLRRGSPHPHFHAAERSLPGGGRWGGLHPLTWPMPEGMDEGRGWRWVRGLTLLVYSIHQESRGGRSEGSDSKEVDLAETRYRQENQYIPGAIYAFIFLFTTYYTFTISKIPKYIHIFFAAFTK